MTRPLRIGVLGVVATALPAITLAVLHMHGSRASATDAADNLRQCEVLAREIETLRISPKQAALEAQSQRELASLLQQAGKSAGVPETSMISIRPDTSRRIAKTAYVEQPTRVDLRQVSMAQLIDFLVEITSRDPRILPNSLRLSAPRGQAAGTAETWQAEVVLTHVVFSPESAGR